MQINTLREAFSQDTSKPFELKQALGLRSPSQESQSTPPASQLEPQNTTVQRAGTWPHLQDANSSKTLSPASEYSHPFEDIPAQPDMTFTTSSFAIPSQAAYAPTSLHQVTSAPQTGYALQPVISNEQTTPVWDPSGIFNQWNTAFGQAQAAPPQQSASIPEPRIQLPSAHRMQQPQAASGQRILYSSQQMPSNGSSIVPETVASMPTVTPVMWQDAFTNAYVSGHGHKRYRDESLGATPYTQYQKRRG